MVNRFFKKHSIVRNSWNYVVYNTLFCSLFGEIATIIWNETSKKFNEEERLRALSVSLMNKVLLVCSFTGTDMDFWEIFLTRFSESP